ncbi:hypothetical protein [Ahniella affigens]|uniref:hypothetical protein n=1 Tax=Ahniella affigens TaxID=2021234 RepID=UPI00147523FF|nr:hypothetical protein [Ahniella affigens]
MTESLHDAGIAKWVAARTTRPDACPDPELLFVFASGALTDDTARATCVAHVAACTACRRAVQMVFASATFATELASDLDAAASSPARIPSADVVGLPITPKRARRIWPLGLAAAAALVVAVLIAPWRPAPDYDTVRAPGAAAVLPPDNATLQSPPSVLRWPCSAAGNTYEVSLLDAKAEPVWRGQTSVCEIELDPALFVERRGSFYWRISPGLDGATSSAFSFEVERAE